LARILRLPGDRPTRHGHHHHPLPRGLCTGRAAEDGRYRVHGPRRLQDGCYKGHGPRRLQDGSYKGHGPAAFRKLDASSFWQRARNALHDHRDTPQTIRDQYPVRFAGCSISAADDVCSSSASSGAHHTVVTVVVARICHRQTASLPGASRRELCLQWRCGRSYGALHMDTAPRPCEKRAQCR
jgi:hypothetical protein